MKIYEQELTYNDSVSIKESLFGEKAVHTIAALSISGLVLCLLSYFELYNSGLNLSSLIIFVFVFSATYIYLHSAHIENSSHIRAQRVADNLGLEYIAKQDLDLKITLASSATYETIIKSKEEDFLAANYVRKDSKGRKIGTEGVVRLRLPGRVPHILLSSKAHKGGISAAVFTKDQRLELEGDFNNYFEVLCPKEYERDALYLLTPDVMHVLVTYGSQYDIEFLDDYIVIYCKGLSYKKQEVDTILTLIANIVDQMNKSVTRYEDEKASSPTEIAVQGQRLKRSIWPTVITVVLIILYLVLTFA